MVPHGLTYDFPLNLFPLDFHRRGFLMLHINYVRNAVKKQNNLNQMAGMPGQSKKLCLWRGKVLLLGNYEYNVFCFKEHNAKPLLIICAFILTEQSWLIKIFMLIYVLMYSFLYIP